MSHFKKKLCLASAKHFELNSGIFKALKIFLNFLPNWLFYKFSEDTKRINLVHIYDFWVKSNKDSQLRTKDNFKEIYLASCDEEMAAKWDTSGRKWVVFSFWIIICTFFLLFTTCLIKNDWGKRDGLVQFIYCGCIQIINK